MKQVFSLIATALWLAGCTWTVDMRPDESEAEGAAAETFFVEAELFYPERVALPGDAEVLVAVDAVTDEGRTPLTRFSTNLAGHQVPLPLGFSVQPEGHEPVLYELSAAILSGGRLLRLTGPVLLMPEEGRASPGEVRLLDPLQAGFGQAWQCEGTELMFGAVDEYVFLAVDGQLHTVEPVPATSGVRYRSSGDAGIGVHEKGEGIVLVRGEEAVADCTRLEALQPPISGGGNEPGWHVEIDERRIELVSDYGQTVTEAPLIQTGASGRTTRFRGVGEHGPILAAFERRVCPDSATGMPHPYVAQVQFEGGRLRGCGGRPRDLLVSREWSVTEVDGEAVSGSDAGESAPEITMQFDERGRVRGRAACNRYVAGYTLTPERLSIERPATTRMACPEDKMALDRRFLELLAGTRRFEIDRQGNLTLLAEDGRIEASADD